MASLIEGGKSHRDAVAEVFKENKPLGPSLLSVFFCFLKRVLFVLFLVFFVLFCWGEGFYFFFFLIGVFFSLFFFVIYPLFSEFH